MKGLLFVVSAPSGAGKTTLIQSVLAKLKLQHPIERVITYTTKKPRANELNGIDYHFIGKELFELKAKDGFFLEWSSDYRANYGTPADILLKLELGISQVLIIDRRGAKRVLELIPSAILIWINVPSLEELEHRLRVRGTENEIQIAYRLERAKIEIEAEQAHSIFPIHIMNNDFASTHAQLEALMHQKLIKKS